MSGELLVEREGSTCLFRLNRPESLNAINAGLLSELTRALRDLPRSMRKEGINALVITGEGKAFCAGVDLKERSLDHAAPASVLQCDYRMALALLGDICYSTRDANSTSSTTRSRSCSMRGRWRRTWGRAGDRSI